MRIPRAAALVGLCVSIPLIACTPGLYLHPVADSAGGYLKTVDANVETRLSRVLTNRLEVSALEPNGTVISTDTIDLGAGGLDGKTVPLKDSEQFAPGTQLKLRLVTTFRRLLSSRVRTAVAEGAGAVSADAVAEINPASSCISKDEKVALIASLSPAPSRDDFDLKAVDNQGILAIAPASFHAKDLPTTLTITSTVLGTSEVDVVVGTRPRLTLARRPEVIVVPARRAPSLLEPRIGDPDSSGARPIALRWDAVGDTEAYAVEIATAAGDPLESSVVPSGSTEYSTTLQPGSYKWRMRARFKGCEGSLVWSEYSAWKTFSVP